MLCALVGSSLWVNNASRLGLPVSTSHSIGAFSTHASPLAHSCRAALPPALTLRTAVGATIGVGIAFRGPGCVQWGNAHHGVGAIVLSWLISPLVAGLAASALFLATRFFVLQAPDSHKRRACLLADHAKP
jgi:phosphate/sulfate permease